MNEAVLPINWTSVLKGHISNEQMKILYSGIIPEATRMHPAGHHGDGSETEMLLP